MTAVDIDLICAEVHAASGNLGFDLNGDNILDQEDVEFLVETILGTHFGDANLDGVVTASGDGSVLLAHLGGTGLGWADGDFNCDSLVTASGDGALLLANLGTDTAKHCFQEVTDDLAAALAGELLEQEAVDETERLRRHHDRRLWLWERAPPPHSEGTDVRAAWHDGRDWWHHSRHGLSTEAIRNAAVVELAESPGSLRDIPAALRPLRRL